MMFRLEGVGALILADPLITAEHLHDQEIIHAITVYVGHIHRHR